MVKLTTDIVERKYSQVLTTKSLSKTKQKNELWKLTHLHMNDMFISSILYLGHNNITIIEGLKSLKKLQELHIESQKMPLGESFCIEPRSAFTLSMCLKVLNISDNKMTSLRTLTGFQELHTLNAKNNLIDNINDLTTTISTLTSLKDLSLQGNPVTSVYRYKENLIANSVLLANLDGKIVTDTCRNFMKKFKLEKYNRHTKNSIKIPLEDDITNSLNLPPAFQRSISRAIFQHPGPHLSIAFTPGSLALGNQLQILPAWKSASGIKNTKDNHVMPRPFWSNVVKDNKNKEPHSTHSYVSNKAISLTLI